MFRSNNVAARIFERQVSSPAPGTSVNTARRFYENIVPSHTIFDIRCPDILFRRFSDDGQYLITFSRNQKDLIVYRPTWLSLSCRDLDCHDHDLPYKSKNFENFFTQLYSVTLASPGELICKEFFLYAEKNRFGLFATSTLQIQDVPPVGGAIPGILSFEKITFYLVSLEDGIILDKRIFCNDFINLANSMGAYLYDDLVAIVSLRYQRIHVLQIRDSGNLVDVQSIGRYCREDDELFLNSGAQFVSFPERNRTRNIASGFHHNQQYPEAPFLGGLMQRLLSFIFKGMWNEEDPRLRMHFLKKYFYFHFQDYADLLIWKVQFLDRHHLLIKFSSADGGVVRNTDNSHVFYAGYNIETTEIISFYQSSADELYTLFEHFCDHFHSSSSNSFYMNFLSSHSNNIHALNQLRNNKNKSSSLHQFVKKLLSTLPVNCQSQSPSAYFDHSLFLYDEKWQHIAGIHSYSTACSKLPPNSVIILIDFGGGLSEEISMHTLAKAILSCFKLISAADVHRQSTDNTIEFVSRRQPDILKFKIKPGPESDNTDIRMKKISSFMFHPILPLAISVQQTLFSQSAVVNIHFRG